jgi:hydroxymethylpyrimidine/phosphomethylpyrimidine kinase
MPPSPPVVLSIAGFDPSSGAGVTADIKTIAAHGCYAITCITALTIQSTQGVREIQPVQTEVVRKTLVELVSDFDIAAVRIGMLGSGDVAVVVAEFIEQAKPKNVVLDPVLRSSSGAELTSASGHRLIRDRLLPLVDVVTPNTDEAEALLGTPVRTPQQMHEAAKSLRALGARAVVVTGGDLDPALDVFYIDEAVEEFRSPKIRSQSTHGTGCAFASSIACNLALGKKMRDAVIEAKVFVQQSIERAYPIGKGIGPVNSLYRFASTS